MFFSRKLRVKKLEVTWNNGGASTCRFQNREDITTFPVPTLSPTTTNTVVAFDIMPNGSPSEVSGNGYAWFDVCDADLLSDGGAACTAARVGVRSDVVEFGSRSFNSGANKPIIFTIGDSPTPTEIMRIGTGGAVFIGDTANANNAKGLTVNQGAADDHALTLKSSDVATGLTSIVAGQDVETDDYFSVEKVGATTGGAFLKALAETGQAVPFILEAWGGAPTTTDTSASDAAMYFRAGQHDGANADVDMAANSNLAAWGEIDSGGNSLTRMLLKADDGELHLGNTTLVAFDDEDDVQLVRAMQKSSSSSGIKLTPYDNPFYDYNKLRAVGLAGERDKDGFFLFPLQSRLHAHEGAIWQMYCRMQELAEEVKVLRRLLPSG